jgi:hypothetical protein
MEEAPPMAGLLLKTIKVKFTPPILPLVRGGEGGVFDTTRGSEKRNLLSTGR